VRSKNIVKKKTEKSHVGRTKKEADLDDGAIKNGIRTAWVM
jgi:hypothetical protein